MSSTENLKRDPGKILGAITVWANEAGAINLGQGFPEFSDDEATVPERASLLAQARDALHNHNAQQYKPPMGTLELRETIAASNEHFYGLNTDPETEILVTQGACAGIYYALNSLLKSDDGRNEVLLIEPFFNFYHSIINDARGVARHFQLEPDENQEWVLDIEKLEAAITDKTKVILLNSPMNPTGKVFSRAELEAIAEIVRRHDLYVVSDEVYEFYTFEGQAHIPFAAIDGMKDRCIRVSSVGKIFGVTDWRVGYASGPAHIIQDMLNSHFYISCGVAGAFQGAASYGLRQQNFLNELGRDFTRKARILSDGLQNAGFLVSPRQGSYFVSANFSALSDADGVDFVEHMIKEHGVAAVPFDPPFQTRRPDVQPSRFLRFCIAKPDDVLSDAATRLQGISGP